MRGALIRKTPAEREAILRILRQVLEQAPQVDFAYIHGSFLEGRAFHDVDVALHLAWGNSDPTSSALGLGRELEGALRRAGQAAPVDVRVLNDAPLGFRYQAFCGKLLFSRNEVVRISEVAQTVARYLDLKPLRQRALKEAMTSWT
jgi:predicted nucleotidyltransferase